MITYTGESKTTDKVVYDFNGLSTDTKPTLTDYPNMDNGSSFMEMDTKTLKFFDLANEQWV